jgi:methylmalonyl-CoA mutase
MTVSTSASTESRDGLALAGDFPRATREEWQRLVAGVLRRSGWAGEAGPDAEEALAKQVEDGVVIRPLYAPGDGGVDDSPDHSAAVSGHPGSLGFPGFAPFLRGGMPGGTALEGWEIRQRHEDPDPARTNAAALDDLEHGATGLWLTAGSAGGVPVEGLPAALDGVLLDLAPVTLEAGADAGRAGDALLALLPGGDGSVAVPHCLGADPLGWVARTGHADTLPELPELTAAATGLAVRCHRDHPGVRAWVVDALPHHEAGATAAQELGCSLAAGVAALRALTEAGLGIGAAARQLEFRYAADADQFLTIAKLRAARRLWSRVLCACGGPVPTHGHEHGGQRQHAVTSRVMATGRDPHVNLLRTTVAALAAGVGGADAVTVLPFDDAVGLPDAAARRLARNTSLILLQESHLARVIDPAGGSWYVEDLTAQLSRAAWAWFQEIERAGGLAAALSSGLVADRIAAAWERRAGRLATRREPITGVSEYADPAETPLTRTPKPPAPGGGLPRVRRDAAFEALRVRSDAHAAATGSRPRVYLATLGPPAEHTGRLTFATSLFAAAGITTADGPPEAYARATPVVCLCGSDGRYVERAAVTAEALVAAGARHVVVAGRPGEHAAAFSAAGIDEFVFAGGDAPAFLHTVLDHLGVAR